MDSLAAVFAGIANIMKLKFGLRLEQVTGDIVIDFIEKTLKDMVLSEGQKAQRDYLVKVTEDLYEKLRPFETIRQPSSEQQADMDFYLKKVKETQLAMERV